MATSADNPSRTNSTAAAPNRSPAVRGRPSSRATENLPGSFTSAITNKIKMTTNERCFMCGHRGQQGAHVVGKSDESVRLLKGKGLINFRLVSVENGIALCARCHIEYDDHCDPKLIFYPSDIKFFIKFELRDRARRQVDGSRRKVPTSQQYMQWCGLYSRIFFDWLGQDKTHIEEPVEWSGAPLAALRRVFGIMGCPRAAGIPMQDLDDIRALWDLYFREDDTRTAQIANLYGFGPENNYGLDDFDGYDNGEMKKNSGSVASGGEDDDNDTTERGGTDLDAMDIEVDQGKVDVPHPKGLVMAGTGPPLVFNMERWRWDFGPESSSDDKVKELFGPTSFM